MKTVLTYGTFDLLHQGHIRLLERARALGDYLIVGITSDNFDRSRGKINNQWTLVERIKAVEATGLADRIIVEEYQGQKLDDVRLYHADIFAVGSDWTGKFDYLREFCQVVYLPRTEGISSSELRAEQNRIRMALIGTSPMVDKVRRELAFVNGVREADRSDCDAVYICNLPDEHYAAAREELLRGRHVLCEAPAALTAREWDELLKLADARGLVLMEGVKTAYSTAFARLLTIARSGVIGDLISVDAVCTSMKDKLISPEEQYCWNSIRTWGPTALLPVFSLLGTDYSDKRIVSRMLRERDNFDAYTKVDFVYPHAVASVRVGKEAKSEGELIITGSGGYIYVPAPWWKTDYFELRYENPAENKRYFYQLEGEGIRNELLAFTRCVHHSPVGQLIPRGITEAVVRLIEDFDLRKDMTVI